ncbi:MAG: hypothetical protein OEZ31_03025 [Nitrospirota bacterium]|nr:hypothetical protein [Nitrospirota bacterium]MDH5767914.1 hypothetical protein [Nitrospirota bacterium]
MIRIALEGGATLDFSKPMGALEKDLSKRDFTINAIAWSPETGIVDPYNGVKDIRQRKIRSLSDKNLISDPLRMLRAYRFAAELNGYIEKGTRKSMKTLHKKIKRASSERITLELFNLLNLKHSAKYLKMALIDGILYDILSISYNQLETNVKEISRFETINKNNSLKIKVLLKKIFSQNLVYKGLICLELLLLNNGAYFLKEHSKIRMSNRIKKRIELAHKGSRQFKEKGKEKLFDVFLASKEASIDVLIISGNVDLIKEYERYKRTWKRGILSSEEVIKVTGVRSGPQIGIMITEIKRAQFEGKVKTKKDAIRLITSII